jgi:hypothetical protein
MMGSRTHQSPVTPEELSRKWGVGFETAREMLKAAMQRGVLKGVHPLTRRCKMPELNAKASLNVLHSKCKSLHGNTCEVAHTAGMFCMVIPMISKSRVGESLDLFVDSFGVPPKLPCGGAAEMTGRTTEFQRMMRKCQSRMEIAEAGRHAQNHVAKKGVGELKQGWKN